MRAIPLAQAALTSPRLLKTRFDSLSALTALPSSSPTKLLLAHARNDGEIPLTHGQALFDGLLEQALGGGRPRARADSMSIEAIELYRLEWDAYRAREAERTERTVIPGWGEIKRFARAEDGKTGQVVFLEALAGGHDNLGGSEGVVALLGSVWGI
jgi:abhydrolase domain-containing protein 12